LFLDLSYPLSVLKLYSGLLAPINIVLEKLQTDFELREISPSPTLSDAGGTTAFKGVGKKVFGGFTPYKKTSCSTLNDIAFLVLKNLKIG